MICRITLLLCLQLCEPILLANGAKERRIWEQNRLTFLFGPIANKTPAPDLPYPLAKVQDVLDSIRLESGPDAIYTTPDIRDGYFRVRVPEEDLNWISFKWNDVQYRLKCVPFGVKTMTSLFQRVKDKIFGDLHFFQVYVGDITVFSNTRGNIFNTFCKLWSA